MSFKKWPLSVMIAMTLILSGCQTNDGIFSDMAGVAAGSALAYKLSDGNNLVTVGGAVGGLGASKRMQYLAAKKIEKAYTRGYEEALSQSVKQQYWITQNRQREDFSNQPVAMDRVPVVIEEQEIDGEILNERVEYIRVERT